MKRLGAGSPRRSRRRLRSIRLVSGSAHTRSDTVVILRLRGRVDRKEVDGAVGTEVGTEIRDVGVDPDVAATSGDQGHELEGNMEEERVTPSAPNEQQLVLVDTPVPALGVYDMAERPVSAGDRPADDVFQRHSLAQLRQRSEGPLVDPGAHDADRVP